jgi:aspartyl-tRNA(Asn)/glutamyl-tRNA(Gln) amidotransferase subunit B
VSWEVVVGIETHAQLLTRSKIFSGAPTAFGAEPNSQASAVDIALPGVLPVLNRGAVERAIRFGLAVGGHVQPRSVFARKNYFYPDLPKGYQISQYEIPVVQGGRVEFVVGDAQKSVRLTRAHLEEDAGKSLHEDFSGMTGADLNRAGTPLLEIVSEPDMRSAEEAVAYAKALHALVRWIDICDGNMQEGSFRCDANVSVRRAGDEALGTRCEIKNLNSFRFIEKAIQFEVRRQVELIDDGGTVVQETRLYDPDLPPLAIDAAWVARVQASLPELPQAMRARMVERHGLLPHEAAILTAERDVATYYERTVAALGGSARLAAHWVIGELSAALNRSGVPVASAKVGPEALAGLLKRVEDKTLSGKLASTVFDAMWNGEGDADTIIAARGLKQISDTGALEKIVDVLLAAHPAIVAVVKAGKEKAFNALVGKAMAATNGKANPGEVNAILKRRLGG